LPKLEFQANLYTDDQTENLSGWSFVSVGLEKFGWKNFEICLKTDMDVAEKIMGILIQRLIEGERFFPGEKINDHMLLRHAKVVNLGKEEFVMRVIILGDDFEGEEHLSARLQKQFVEVF